MHLCRLCLSFFMTSCGFRKAATILKRAFTARCAVEASFMQNDVGAKHGSSVVSLISSSPPNDGVLITEIKRWSVLLQTRGSQPPPSHFWSCCLMSAFCINLSSRMFPSLPSSFLLPSCCYPSCWGCVSRLPTWIIHVLPSRLLDVEWELDTFPVFLSAQLLGPSRSQRLASCWGEYWVTPP